MMIGFVADVKLTGLANTWLGNQALSKGFRALCDDKNIAKFGEKKHSGIV